MIGVFWCDAPPIHPHHEIVDAAKNCRKDNNENHKQNDVD